MSGPERLPIRHGTTYGYRAHLKRWEFPCADCRRAERRRRARARDAAEFAAVWLAVDVSFVRERRAQVYADSLALREQTNDERGAA